MQTITDTDLHLAANFLDNGELIAIPTETVYGLAGNALNDTTVMNIFRVKERPAFDPLIVHVADADEVMHYVVDIPLRAQQLMEAFWPGPLTIVLKKKSIIPDLVTSGLDTVGMRMPSHPLTLELLNHLKFPLAAPSANPFGYISPTSAKHVMDQLSGKIPYILDGGDCSVGLESTIVGFEEDRCVVYRLGGLTLEAIRKVVPELEIQVNISSDPKAPGMLKSHYAPRKQLLFGDFNTMKHHLRAKRCAVLSFAENAEVRANAVVFKMLSPENNIDEAARNLFAALRELDNADVDLIIAEPVPDFGLGKAINDRLKRAAG
ncbi:L-threonylcarbamoyladenylate synthase [soil metagenome]